MTRVRVIYAGRVVDHGELLDLSPIGPWQAVAKIRSDIFGEPTVYVSNAHCQIETIEEEQ